MRPEKASIVQDIASRLNTSPYLFVADYTGLKVGQFAELRNRLSGVGARCYVVKNSFLRRALTDAGLPELTELKGQTAIITGDRDVAATAKVLKNFTAEFKKPSLQTGIVDRLVVSSDQIKTIADLPAREVLLSQLLGLLNSPASTLVRLLNEPASRLARVLQAHAEQQGGGDSAPAPAAEAEAPAAAPAAPEAPAAEAPAAAPEAAAPAPAAPEPPADAPAA